jgi:hypothetical protein
MGLTGVWNRISRRVEKRQKRLEKREEVPVVESTI